MAVGKVQSSTLDTRATRATRATPPLHLAYGAKKADKPLMSRRQDDRATLSPLVADLSRRFSDFDARWRRQIEPQTLRSLRRKLDEAGIRLASSACTPAELDRARSIAAEMMVAARLLEEGCEIEHEVQTPTGKHVDFRARKDGAVLCVHVKRAPHSTLHDAPIFIPAAWRALESIERAMVIALSVTKNLRGRALQTALTEANEFALQASVGDEITFRDAESRTAARLRVIAPSTGRAIELVADLSSSFDDHVPRFQSTLRKAFAQFMPRSENLIVVCGSTGGIEAFATALLGSQIERWDKRPRMGELVAYGRGGDGFWAGSMRNQSRLASYWALALDSGPLLFLRERGARTSTARAVQMARDVFA
jgi:hypothetical protein